MSMKPRVVVLGAGFAGLTLCTRLQGLAEAGLAQVTLIERNSALSIGGLYQFALKRQIDPQSIAVSYDGGDALKCSSVQFLQDEVADVDVVGKCVTTRSATIPYDYLVIASGARYAPECVPGLEMGAYNVCSLGDVLMLRSALDRFDGGTLVMSIPRTPYKCPTVPQEYALVVETLLRERSADLRNRTRLVFATAADGPFPMTGFFNERFERFGIESLIYAPVCEVDNRNRQLIFGEGRDGRTVEPIHFDLLMATFPLAAHRAFESLCDDTGLIPSHPRSMKTPWDGVWALGDCAAMRLASGPLHPKAGAFAICQAQALAENIEALVRSNGQHDHGAENLGIAQCDAEVGNNEGASVAVNLMGGPSSRFELGPVCEAAVHDKLDWISDCLALWFTRPPRFKVVEEDTTPRGQA